MVAFLKKILSPYSLGYLKRDPINWLYSAYLTFKYVDEWQLFPAIIVTGHIRIKILKFRNASIKIQTRLIFETWLNSSGETTLTLKENSLLSVGNEFVLGQGLKIYLGPNARLVLKGKVEESGSGITADSVVMVNKYLEIGQDCIIAWNTFITDCDWHCVDGKSHTKPTVIGSHVWIGVGSKILKGANIGKNSIVCSNTTVLQGNYAENSLLGGNPGIVLKTNYLNWKREMD